MCCVITTFHVEMTFVCCGESRTFIGRTFIGEGLLVFFLGDFLVLWPGPVDPTRLWYWAVESEGDFVPLLLGDSGLDHSTD